MGPGGRGGHAADDLDLDGGTTTMKMFVFPFGDGYYDKQSAVVLAETIEEAKAKLLFDIARQTANHRRWPDGQPDPNWNGQDGFNSVFRVERLIMAENYDDDDGHMTPWVVDGEVAYIYGVDG